MNNMPLEILYKNLISRLWEELLFYIPDNEITNEFLENHKEIEFEKFRDKIIIIDYYKGPTLYELGRNNNQIILKSNTLKKSIRQLLNAKANSNEQEFNYILELYYEQVECIYFITNWLNVNITQVLPQEESILGLFKLQYNFHKSHFETILKQFYPDMQSLPKGNFNIGKSLESSLPQITKLFNTENKQKIIPEASNLQEDRQENLPTSINKKERKRNIKKPPIISDTEAETILLKRIFNIDLETHK
ncbi:hypothetical protein [Maribacter hydrothermalis]|uniref:Uncharacterized protein n=1 Tax=Maribacter hydrothermalis TaxID=1836467 RepID=A0A1B7Z687_9FLAO|nr:hypothetical protein [Maribacter hydrothermalis]APQ16725.1 hypothetical protein BTR34_05055 [Maribacter hydrothermalis]OBR38186.1 hypothetical protein A9200_18060 [Maribacter hydrothermalis]